MNRFVKSIARPILNVALGKVRFQRFFEKMLNFSMLGMNIGGGAVWEESGENNVCKYIAKKLPTEKSLMVFDVGANVGNWSRMCSSFLHPSFLYAFEPSEKTFMKMQENTKSISNIKRFNFGFGSKSETLTLFSNKNESGIASVYNRNLEHFSIEMSQEEKIQIRTIDDFCEEQGIKHIHFLKMDVEGHELEALKGAKNMLSKDAIDFIQFEFGGANIDSRTYFQNFYYLLKEKYRIYRILRDGVVELPEYKEQYELFRTTNFLAQRNEVSL